MKILISTFGVRGDVQPYLALAVGLQTAGHRVTLARSQNFTAWIESYGIHTHPNGGAGTTGAGLRAGVPSLITPYAPNDQPAWAEQVVRLGVGLRLPGFKQITAEKLAQAIDTAFHDAALRTRAAAVGAKIRTEDGVALAVAIIEKHVRQHRR